MSIVFDHVGIAVPRRGTGWRVLRGVLGGEWGQGGETSDFGWHQFRYANGVKVELLHPVASPVNPFLSRFLARHGPGVHHLTFRVCAIRDVMRASAAAGFPILTSELQDAEWQEAFIDPAATQGILVQLGQIVGGEGPPLTPDDGPRAERPATTLLRSSHPVENLERVLDFFCGPLQGRLTRRGEGTADVTWAGDRCLRLIEGRRPERIGEAELTFQATDESARSERQRSDELGVDIVLRARRHEDG
jgi:methylmalonyl-CoA/ethylmalonyl-CoA epimerase